MHYRIAFVLNFSICYFLMKVMSAYVARENIASYRDFFLSPYLSPRTLRLKVSSSFSSILMTFFLSTFLTFLLIFLGKTFLPMRYEFIILLAPVILFLTEAVGALGQLLFYAFTPHSCPIHFRPLSSRNLGEFWGRHWNIWIQDWLKDISRSIRVSGTKRFLVIFLFSGLFHEAMVNLPYWLIYKKSYFGTMLAYFFIQAIGLKVEKNYLSGLNPVMKKTFMYLMVFLPSPLFVNVPLLTFLGFIHE
jgi:hypothetical protein